MLLSTSKIHTLHHIHTSLNTKKTVFPPPSCFTAKMQYKVFGLMLGLRTTSGVRILASETDLSGLPFFQRFSAGEALIFFAKTIIQRTEIGSKSKIKEASFLGHVSIREDGLAAVLVTEDNYPVRSAFSIINNVMNEFTSKFPNNEQWPDLTPDKTKPLYPELAVHLKNFKDPEKADPFFKIQKDLDETIGVVNKTFESLIERGEKLDDLVGRSEDLSASSKAFYIASKKTNSCC